MHIKYAYMINCLICSQNVKIISNTFFEPRILKTKRKSVKRNKRPFGKFFANTSKIARRTLLWVLLRASLICFSVLLTSIIYFYFIIPPFDVILDGRRKGSVTFLDRNGDTFAWRGQQFDSSLRSTNASPFLVDAIISSEDKNFYRHFGLSIRGIFGAIRINLSEGRGPLQGHGGSTITQQVAKLLCMMNKEKLESSCRRQSLARKILEIPFSIALELKFSKSEILSIYMNRVYLGANAVGFEAAAQRYFDKSATEVSISESAMLAGLLKAPSRYAPTRDLILAQKRARIVIESMLRENYISPEDAQAAINLPARLSKNAQSLLGAHFVDWIMRDAPTLLTSKTTEDILIKTTFDPVVQKKVESSISNIFKSHVRQNSKADVAVVVMTSVGDVVAMLGSRKNTRTAGQYNRAFQAYRQPGSVFKPFVYAAALEQGYAPDYLLIDTRQPPSKMANLKYWPKNHNDLYLGKMKMEYGLVNSVNTVTVQLAHLAGLQNVIKIATGFGIKSKLKSNLSLALGSSEVSLLELTSAYAGFLNLGRQTHPRGWVDLRIKSSNEILIKSSTKLKTQVIKPNVAKAIVNMLVSVVETGTGREALIKGWQVAGKTGTTQDARDAWFIGFTSDYVVGVWIGADDNTPLKGVVGGNLPAKIWRDIIQRIHKDIPGKLPALSASEYNSSIRTIVEPKRTKTIQNSNKFENTNIFKRFYDYLQILNK